MKGRSNVVFRENSINDRSNRNYLLVFGVILLVGVGLYFVGFGASSQQASSGQPSAGVQDAAASTLSAQGQASDVVRIPLSQVSDKVSFLSEVVGGKTIKFMVVKGSDGKVRTAFDGCEVCGGSLGYRQDGSDVICNKCGKTFRIDDLGSGNGGRGCFPANLPHIIEGQDVVIKKSDLSGKAYLF